MSSENELYRETVEATNSLKYALSVAHRTNDCGVEIASELHKQGSQIDGMNVNLDKIDNNNSMAMRHIRSIKSALGTFVNFFLRAPVNNEETPNTNNAPIISENNGSAQNFTTQQNRQQNRQQNLVKDRSIDFFTEDAYDEYKREMMEQDRDLDELSSVLTNIHALAQNMNSELDGQNEKLRRIAGRVDDQTYNINNTTSEINKLL